MSRSKGTTNRSRYLAVGKQGLHWLLIPYQGQTLQLRLIINRDLKRLGLPLCPILSDALEVATARALYEGATQMRVMFTTTREAAFAGTDRVISAYVFILPDDSLLVAESHRNSTCSVTYNYAAVRFYSTQAIFEEAMSASKLQILGTENIIPTALKFLNTVLLERGIERYIKGEAMDDPWDGAI